MDYFANDKIMTMWHSDLSNPLPTEEMQPRTSTPKPKRHRMQPLPGKRYVNDNSFAPEANHHQRHQDLEGASNLRFTIRSDRKKGVHVPLEPVGKSTDILKKTSSPAHRLVKRRKGERRRHRAQATSTSSSDRGLSDIYRNIIPECKSSVLSKEDSLSPATLPSTTPLLTSPPAVLMEQSQEDWKKRILMLNRCRSKARDEANWYQNYNLNIYYYNE